jgi:hypothetical protein
MKVSERRVLIDMFNVVKHPFRIFISNAELVSEGLSLVDTSKVIVESPLSRLDKYLQVCDRPKRYGQLELHIDLLLLFNRQSRVDCNIMKKQMLARTQAQKVSEQETGDGSAQVVQQIARDASSTWEL